MGISNTEVAVFNRALRKLGAKPLTSVVGTEGTGRVADATGDTVSLNLALEIFEDLKQVVLSQRIWGFALSSEKLDTVDSSTPAFGFDNRFHLPSYLDNGINIAEIASGGTGYAVNDELTVSSGGSGTGFKTRVTAVSGGVVTAISTVNRGKDYREDDTLLTMTGGGGSGCTLTIQELYARPVRIWRVNGDNETDIDWRLQRDYIYVKDVTSIEIEYIGEIFDVADFPSVFVDALVFRIAAEISPTLSKDRANEREYMKTYQETLDDAGGIDGSQASRETIKSERLVSARIKGGMGYLTDTV